MELEELYVYKEDGLHHFEPIEGVSGYENSEAIKVVPKSVLDDIKAEIEEIYMNLSYEENHKVSGSWGLRKALDIIDKHIAESEE